MVHRFISSFLTFPLIALALAGCGAGAERQAGGDYPTKDIEFIVPFDPGGGYDAWARLLAPFIEKHLPNKVKVVVKNSPGAGGLSAATQMYAANPDGTQIQIMNLTGLAAAALAGESKFDLRKFTYLGRVTTDPQVLYVAGNSDTNSIDDLKALSQARPVKQAMTGFSSSEGVNTVILYDLLGINYTPVMHDGNEEARLSIIRGDTDAGIGSLESTLGELQSGDLKPILYVGEEKPAQDQPGYREVKDTRTMQDAGYAELATGLQAQRVIAGPPGLPDDIKQVLDKALQDAMNDPDFLAKAKESEMSVHPLDAAATTDAVTNALDTLSRYRDILKKAVKENSGG